MSEGSRGKLLAWTRWTYFDFSLIVAPSAYEGKFMRVKCSSCGRKVSDLMPTCEYCGANRKPRIRRSTSISAQVSPNSNASTGIAVAHSDTSTSFDFWVLMSLLLNAVWDLAKISIVGGLGYVMFFTGLLTDIPFWIILPIKVYLSIMGFLLYFKPSIVAWNLNRDLLSHSIFSLVLGEKLSYGIKVTLRFALAPVVVPVAVLTIVPLRLVVIFLHYLFNSNDELEELDYKALLKAYFFPPPLIDGDGQFRKMFLKDGVTLSPTMRLNPFYYTGFNARVQHRYFVIIFFVNLILGATGVIWLGTHVFAQMGLWMQDDEFHKVLENGVAPHIDEVAT